MNYARLVFCLPDLHACALVHEIKTNASRLWMQAAVPITYLPNKHV